MKLKAIIFLLGAALAVGLAVLPGLGQDEELLCGGVVSETGDAAAAKDLKCKRWHWSKPPARKCQIEHISEGTGPLGVCSKLTIGNKRYHIVGRNADGCWQLKRLLDSDTVPTEL